MEWRNAREDELLRELYEAKILAERREREKVEAEAAELLAGIQARERDERAARQLQVDWARQQHALLTSTLAEEFERVALERDEALAIQVCF